MKSFLSFNANLFERGGIMERLPQDKILEYNPDTLQAVRKIYNLDKPGQMDNAIDLLDNWIKKQSHFKKKDYPREYLERVIILLKGSVERAKSQMDKICTLRTMLPHFFNNYENPREQFKCLQDYNISVTYLPKLTKDHYRLYVTKLSPSTPFTSKLLLQLYYYLVVVCEYMKLHDYSDGVIMILDYRDINIMDFVTAINLVEMKQIATIFLEAYDTRAKNFYVISTSKAVDVLVKIFKQLISEKLAKRMFVLKDIEELYEYVPKELLPSDYGGNEKSLATLTAQWMDALSTEENIKYLKTMSTACVDESLRSSSKVNDQFVGLSGTFRTLNVD